MIKEKLQLLKTMYSYVGDDDEMYAEWIEYFPDEPSEDDLLDIVENSWVQACVLLGRLVKDYPR